MNIEDYPLSEPTSRIQAGMAAPDIDVSIENGQKIRLSELKGQPYILAFSTEWDPAWAQQLSQYAHLLGQTQLIGVSYDGVWCRLDSDGGSALNFPVLHQSSDNTHAAKLFGVEHGQAVFVINSEGVVRWSHFSQAGVHPSVDALQIAIGDLQPRNEVSRRNFLISGVAASLALAILPGLARGETKRPETAGQERGDRTITLHVNGQSHQVTVDNRTSLLDALRERMGLTGTKKGCDHGQCGACTVHIDGRRVNSCLTLAVQAEGAAITTIEGLAQGDRLHPIQEAFIKHDGFQCGYCTPGQIMSALACIQEGHTGSEDEIKEWMSGNICRCGAYPGICAAIEEAKTQIGGTR